MSCAQSRYATPAHQIDEGIINGCHPLDPKQARFGSPAEHQAVRPKHRGAGRDRHEGHGPRQRPQTARPHQRAAAVRRGARRGRQRRQARQTEPTDPISRDDPGRHGAPDPDCARRVGRSGACGGRRVRAAPSAVGCRIRGGGQTRAQRCRAGRAACRRPIRDLSAHPGAATRGTSGRPHRAPHRRRLAAQGGRRAARDRRRRSGPPPGVPLRRPAAAQRAPE